MSAKVADACVLAALAFKEPQAEEAADLLKHGELHEPSLLAYELASIARKKILRYPKTKSLILQALKIVLAMDIRWIEVDHLAAVGLALETGLTPYDASYLYTARLCGAPLLTFDRQLAKFSKPD